MTKTKQSNSKNRASARALCMPKLRSLSRIEWALVATIVGVTALIYCGGLQHDFTNWDDQKYVLENTVIRDLSWSGLREIFTRSIAANYHPLTVLSLALDYQVSGVEATTSYHVTNVLLHVLNTFLVFVLVYLTSGSRFAVALFVSDSSASPQSC